MTIRQVTDGQTTEYKGEISRLMLYWLITKCAIAIILFVVQSNIYTAVILLGVVNVFYLGSLFNKPIKIRIHQDRSLLEVHYLIGFLKRPKVVSLSDVQSTFEHEVQARGGKAKVLRVTYNNQSIVELLVDFNGWDEKRLAELWESLQNVKKFNHAPSNQT